MIASRKHSLRTGHGGLPSLPQQIALALSAISLYKVLSLGGKKISVSSPRHLASYLHAQDTLSWLFISLPVLSCTTQENPPLIELHNSRRQGAILALVYDYPGLPLLLSSLRPLT